MRFLVLAGAIVAASLAFVPIASAQMKHGVFGDTDWRPPKPDMAKMQDMVDAWFAALKDGRDDDMFRLRKDGRNANDPLDAFRQTQSARRDAAGGLVSVKPGLATWSKGPPVSVVLDFQGRLERAGRYCGLLAIEQMEDGSFRVAREFEVYMTDTEAAEIAARSPPGDVATEWTRKAALTCPSY